MTRKKLSQNEDEFIKGAAAPVSKPAAKVTEKASPTEDALMQILSPAPATPREATIRFTADLPVVLHRRLTLAAAKAGKSKVDIVREVLEFVLPAEQ